MHRPPQMSIIAYFFCDCVNCDAQMITHTSHEIYCNCMLYGLLKSCLFIYLLTYLPYCAPTSPRKESLECARFVWLKELWQQTSSILLITWFTCRPQPMTVWGQECRNVVTGCLIVSRQLWGQLSVLCLQTTTNKSYSLCFWLLMLAVLFATILCTSRCVFYICFPVMCY